MQLNEALRYARPDLFVVRTEESPGEVWFTERDPRLVTAEFYAQHIVEDAFRFFSANTRTRKEVIEFTNRMGLQFTELVRFGFLADATEQLRQIEPVGPVKYVYERHTSNEYHCVVRNPGNPDSKAEKLFAIQIIHADSKTNGDHSHENPRRSECMFSLSGELPVEIHAYHGGPRIRKTTLKPGEMIFIEPYEWHSVKSSSLDSVNIVVGMPLREIPSKEAT